MLASKEEITKRIAQEVLRFLLFLLFPPLFFLLLCTSKLKSLICEILLAVLKLDKGIDNER